MKNFMLALPLALYTGLIFADCKVYVPEKTFLHDSGYSISFDFTRLFSDKGYQEVYSAGEAQHTMYVAGIEVEGRLHKAQGTLRLDNLEVSERVTCLTQFCGISDYAKAFNKAYKKLSKQLTKCQN